MLSRFLSTLTVLQQNHTGGYSAAVKAVAEIDPRLILIGGMAFQFHVPQIRATADVDFLIATLHTLPTVAERLASHSDFERRTESKFVHRPSQVPVELIYPGLIEGANDKLIQKAQQFTQFFDLEGTEILLAKPELVCALKLNRATDETNPKHLIDRSDILLLLSLLLKTDPSLKVFDPLLEALRLHELRLLFQLANQARQLK